MKIGFDAKRAFQNRTGLGNYSRTLLTSLMHHYPDHEYALFAPKKTNLFPAGAYQVITPDWQPAKTLSALWRSRWMKRDLMQTGVSMYHGLSNELPAGIRKTGIPSVVTIHDLIFEKHPAFYHNSEVWIYKKKFRAACRNADLVLATSEHTKKDILELYNISPDRVVVCYQSCDPLFWQQAPQETSRSVKEKYNLPSSYFLYLGSIIARKDLLTVCKAMKQMQSQCDIPLVVIGEGKGYKKEVQWWLRENGLQQQVLFLSEQQKVMADPDYLSGADFRAIYHHAMAFIYPSVYEGFGIPVLEAMASQTPVIAANATSLPEVGGNAALYFNPGQPGELADLMVRLAGNTSFREERIQAGSIQAQQFSAKRCADDVMKAYNSMG